MYAYMLIRIYECNYICSWVFPTGEPADGRHPAFDFMNGRDPGP
jgi:hypothetical protein